MDLVQSATDIERALRCLRSSIIPTGYSGDRSSMLLERLDPITELEKHEIREIRDWAQATRSEMEKLVTEAIKSEKKERRRFDERFES